MAGQFTSVQRIPSLQKSFLCVFRRRWYAKTPFGTVHHERNSFCAFVLKKILVCVYYVEAPTSTAVKTAETKFQCTPNSHYRQNGGVAKRNTGLIASTPNQTQ